MKKLIFLLILTTALAFCLGTLFGQEADLTGTWEGTTYVPDSGDDRVTLTLRKEGETYSGTVSDSMELAVESKLENVQFEDGTLKAEFVIFNGSDYVRISLTLKVSGEMLVGHWADPGGETGTLEMKRKG
ncbi:MAG: hypothetical protein WBC70_04645 [Candidatus Aminicenantales bacterium]